MKKYEHIRIKARKLRQQKKSIDEISNNLHLPRTTIYYWVKDIPLNREVKINVKKAAAANKKKWELIRNDWYQTMYKNATEVLENRIIRDFIVMYMAEGYKRNRNAVGVCNSDPKIIAFCCKALRILSDHPFYCEVTSYPDLETEKLKHFWGNITGLPLEEIRIYLKQAAGNLKGRNHRLEYGTAAIRMGNTKLKMEINALIDYTKETWI